MATAREVLSLLAAGPSRRPHEVLAWAAVWCLVAVAAAYSPWMPWPPQLRGWLIVVFLVAAGVLAVFAVRVWRAARRAADIDRQMAELDEQDAQA